MNLASKIVTYCHNTLLTEGTNSRTPLHFHLNNTFSDLAYQNNRQSTAELPLALLLSLYVLTIYSSYRTIQHSAYVYTHHNTAPRQAITRYTKYQYISVYCSIYNNIIYITTTILHRYSFTSQVSELLTDTLIPHYFLHCLLTRISCLKGING